VKWWKSSYLRNKLISTAIILAGGLGTRLQSVVKDLPKSMADIAGKPFLEYQLNYLHSQKIKDILLSVGYKYESIQNHFGNKYKNISISYAIEKEPLGTGGAVINALKVVKEDSVFILNGDTFFPVSLEDLFYNHCEKKAALSIALKEMHNFDRYGVVNIDADNAITGFEEKRFREQGLINGGIYLADSKFLHALKLPEKFSLEKDVFEKHGNKVSIYGFPFTNYLIDIGIPEDYARAQHELLSYAN
jgi:D-glycero-alpha-D-manno-heptose 1-phosphate guanylyltransferase